MGRTGLVEDEDRHVGGGPDVGSTRNRVEEAELTEEVTSTAVREDNVLGVNILDLTYKKRSEGQRSKGAEKVITFKHKEEESK